MVLVAVVLVVLTVGVYFGYQVTRFLSSPTLTVNSPASITYTVPIGTTNYKLTGTATAGSTVTIAWNNHDPSSVVADDGGQWSYQAVLVPGRNEFDIKAQNIDTNHASKLVIIVITVPTPTPSPVTPVVAFVTPADNSIISDGNVTITGTSSFVTAVTLTTTYLGVPPAPGATLPPPSGSTGPASGPSSGALATPTPVPSATKGPLATAGPSAPPAPAPVSTSVTDKGDFNFAFQLEPGVWRLSLAGTDTQGHKSAIVTRTVAVPFTGVVVGIQVKGQAGAWMKYWRDTTPIGQSTYLNGYSTTVSAKKSVCIYTAKPGNVYVTVNGVAIGTVAQYGGTHLFIDATHPPKNVSACP
jgi:hypothetical protein